MYIKSITLRPCSGAGPRMANSRPRIYIHPEGETLVDNLHNRRERPYSVYKKEVLPKLWRLLGVAAPKVSWSQKAGCRMCPCSPGFVVPNYDLPYDVHVTVTDKYVSSVKMEGNIAA